MPMMNTTTAADPEIFPDSFLDIVSYLFDDLAVRPQNNQPPETQDPFLYCRGTPHSACRHRGGGSGQKAGKLAYGFASADWTRLRRAVRGEREQGSRGAGETGSGG